jgi:Na+-translocating ferredoxin:NAD+ oxidoreductase RNF subunit RnfB
VLAIIIVLADRKFYIAENSKVKEVISLLPSANCGACGFAGCAAFAQALVNGKAKPTSCIPGGAELAGKLAHIFGEVNTEENVEKTAKIHCKGGIAEAKERAVYDGITDCFAAVLVANGSKECEYGCLGFGSCVKVCPFNAILINKNGIAAVNEEKCVGCGVCVSSCPRKLIDISPKTQKVFVACSNHDKGAKVKQYCSVGCTGCSVCTKAVTIQNSITMDDYLPKLDYDMGENFIVAARKCPSHSFTDLVKARPTVNIDTKCVGCGNCIKACPVKEAIEGKPGERHSVNKNLCIGCGRCISSCEARAIGIWGAVIFSQKYHYT